MNWLSKKMTTNGFTLLEVIITLLVASILGTTIYTFLGTSVTKSGIPVNLIKEDFEFVSVLEKITNDYRQKIETAKTAGESFDLAAFVTDIDSAAKVNALYGSTVDSVTIVPTAFDASGNETGSDDNIQKVTLQKGDSILTVLLTQ